MQPHSCTTDTLVSAPDGNDHGDARTPSEALAEIRRSSATQLDPVVVEALAAALVDLTRSSLAEIPNDAPPESATPSPPAP